MAFWFRRGLLALALVLVACGSSQSQLRSDAGLTPDASVPDAGVPDAGVPDGGSPDSGVPDAGVPDAGPCAGVDLQSDVNNCGACGNVCAFPNAGASCQSGACVMGGCDAGFHDVDGDAGDGCEYACVPTVPSTEVCDGVDNDCNGAIDDSPTDPDLGTQCGAPCPGGSLANCVGACRPGTLSCQGGAKVCVGGQGPTTEVCDGVDNDCNGQVDEPFTATYSGGTARLAPT